jgi:hypothetical protein
MLRHWPGLALLAAGPPASGLVLSVAALLGQERTWTAGQLAEALVGHGIATHGERPSASVSTSC